MNGRKKKILFVITKSNWGGAQRYVYDLATNLPKKSFDVAVAFGGTGEPGADIGHLGKLLQEGGVSTIFIKNFARDIYLVKDILAFFELYSLFKKYKKEGLDVVHLSSSKAGGIGALAAYLSGIENIVFTSHGLSWDEDRNIIFRTLIFLASYVTFILCCKIITVSKDNFKRVKRLRLCSKKVVLIHNGIAQIYFNTKEDARRKIVGIPIKDTPWIGTIAEFTRNKGLVYLVDVASLLKKRGLTFRMSLIGDGKDLPNIKKRAEENGLYNNPGSSAYIDFRGFMPDFAINLKAFDIFILTSVKEGLPYVLLEAGQAGIPVVASSVGGVPDIIVHEKTGLLVTPGDIVEIANALQKLIDNKELREKYGSSLKDHVTSNFSIENMMEKTVEVYAT